MNHQYDPTRELVAYAVKVMAWGFVILSGVVLAGCVLFV
jgi:hypothetical protein